LEYGVGILEQHSYH